MFVRRSFVAAAAALVALPSLATAQQVSCAVTGPVGVQGFAQDACQKATDLFSFVMPQIGQAMAGGGAILGTANTLGGLGKFSFNVRVNAVRGRAPQVDGITLNALGPVPSAIATEEVPVPAPVVDVGVGIFRGLPVGRTQMFSLDGIVNVAYLPETDLEDLSVKTPSGRLKLGYGGRLGITRDGRGIPAISISYIRRDLPTADLRASFQGGSAGQDSIALTGFQVRTDAIRASISKKLGFLEIGGGYGRDTYDARLNIGARVSETAGTGTASYSYVQNVERDVMYGTLALNFPAFKIAAEVGQASGGTEIRTFNTFVDGGQDDARLFGTVGIRFSF